ncbi:zinc finger BED domain-containing protein RICESLEEPER 3 [Tanacetum coccineum]
MFPVLSRMAMDILSVQATSVASESAFSTSHLDAQERKQDKSTLETPVDFEEEILDPEVQENEAIPLFDEEIALDAASSEGSMSGPGSGGEEAADYGYYASGNDQDIHSINESQEEGEINDKKEQMGYEMNAPGKSVDSVEEGEIIGESDDGCVKDCMGKKLDPEDPFLMVIEVNDTIEDNADVTHRLTSLWKLIFPEVANDSSIVSPSYAPE